MEIATKYKAGAFFAGMDLSGIDLGKYYKASKVLDIASMRRFAIADSAGEYSIKSGAAAGIKHYKKGDCLLSNLNGEIYFSLSTDKFLEKYRILYLENDRRIEETVEDLPDVKTSIIKLLLPRGLYCIKNEFLLENRTYALQINEPFKCGGEYGHGGDWIVKINDAQPKISRAGVFEYRYVPFLRKE